LLIKILVFLLQTEEIFVVLTARLTQENKPNIYDLKEEVSKKKSKRPMSAYVQHSGKRNQVVRY